MSLQELLPDYDLSTDNDALPSCPKLIQDCAELHENNSEFRYSIVTCLLKAVVTSYKSESKRCRRAGIGLGFFK